MSGQFSIHSGVEPRRGGENGQGGEENREEMEQASSDTGILARPSHGRMCKTYAKKERKRLGTDGIAWNR